MPISSDLSPLTYLRLVFAVAAGVGEFLFFTEIPVRNTSGTSILCIAAAFHIPDLLRYFKSK